MIAVHGCHDCREVRPLTSCLDRRRRVSVALCDDCIGGAEPGRLDRGGAT